MIIAIVALEVGQTRRFGTLAVMVRLFDGEVDVAYMQFYIETPDVLPGEDVERRHGGQTNGLCRAGEPGMLQCTTGLHTGPVPVTVDLLDTAPDGVDTGWEDVVEVSLTTTTPHVVLYDWDHQQPVELPLGQGTFRVRYHATGMDTGRDADVRRPGEPVLDRYLLQFWPAPPGPDAVLRHTSEIAGYWHDAARNTPDPTTPEARAEAASAEDELVAFHALLADITVSGPQRQRAAATWLAHRAADAAGPATNAWLRPALDALDHGQPLPAPFDDHRRARTAAHRDLANLEGTRDYSATDNGQPQAPQTSLSALSTVLNAANPDPWAAVMIARNVAPSAGCSEAELHAELRARFLS